MTKLIASPSQLPGVLGLDRSPENRARSDQRLVPTLMTASFFTLGIASIALALTAAFVLHAERKSTVILHHVSVIALNLQDVLSDLAYAEAEERDYLLSRRLSSLKQFANSREALELEFGRLTGLVRNNPVESREVRRIRRLVQEELDELQSSITSRSTAASPPDTSSFTERTRKLTEALRQSVTEIDHANEGTLARLSRQRRIRLASALVAICAAVLLSSLCLFIGEIILRRASLRRQQSEEALHASEKRFETLCENAPVGIYSTDARGLFVYTNSRWSQLSGLSAAESLGDGWREALHPDDRETIFRDWKTHAVRGASWDYRLLTPQGHVRWIRALGGPIYAPTGEITGFVGTVEDVTEREQGDRALRESEALNRAVLNSLPANIAVLSTDGVIEALNDRWRHFAEANGDPPASTVGIGVNYLEACSRAAGSDAQQALAGIQSVLSKKVPAFRMEYPCHSPAEKRWFHMVVTPLVDVDGGGVVVTHSDITELKQTQEAMQEALQQLQLITDNMAAGVTRCSRDLRYVWVNRSYAAWLGQSRPEDAAGRRIVDVVGQEFFDKVRPYVESVLSGEKVEYETQLKYPDAGVRWTHAVYAPTRARDHTVDGWISVVVDVTERHEAEERLRESEERFRVIFYQAAVGISQTGIDSKWMLLNDRLCEFLGYSRDELRGKTFIDVTHPEDRETSLTAARKLIAGEIASWSSEKRYIRKDGVTVWGRLFVSLVRGRRQQPLYFITVVEDITRMIEAQQKLRESEQRFRKMADAAPVMIWCSGPDMGRVFFNKVWLDFTGRTMEQELGVGWADGIHPHDRYRCLSTYSSAFAERRSFQMEYRLRRADGEYRWLLDNSVPRFTVNHVFEGYIGSCIDITERRHQEDLREELRREQAKLAEARGMERFRLSFDEAPVGMALIRSDGAWLRVNRALCRMTGYDESELIHLGRELTHEDDRAQELGLLSRLRSGEVASGHLEERYLHKAGHAIYILLSIATVERDGAGRPVYFVAHVEDLSERKLVERELEASRAQMAANSRLSALGMMAGGIAHEINNPLGIIQASSENLLRMADSGSVPMPALVKNCNRINVTAQRMAKIVRSLRRVAREGSADEFRRISVCEIVEETLELCAERFRAHDIRLVVSAIVCEAAINCREAQICQVLLNLLQNAFDEVVDLEGERWVSLAVSLLPPWVVFSVSDSGPGISPEVRQHLMEPFFTTKPVGKGTGLGLSISRSIALEHGGTLELDQESIHTCFVLKLPLSEGSLKGI